MVVNRSYKSEALTSQTLDIMAKEKEEYSNIAEAIERNWEIPDINFKDIYDAIPPHCFVRDTFRSFSYLAHDICWVTVCGLSTNLFDKIPYHPLRVLAWPIYWMCQGTFFFGLWGIAHECGHLAFSPSKLVSHSVGFVIHSALLTPYHSWRYSHTKHHKGLGDMAKDPSNVPLTRSDVGLPPHDKDPQADGPHSMLEEMPIVTLFNLTMKLLFGWPIHLLTYGHHQKYDGWTSYFNPYCDVFPDSQFWPVVASNVGVCAMITALGAVTYKFGSMFLLKHYILPYFSLNIWILTVTYLQHTNANVPHYRNKVWNFQRGAALTVDRSYGTILNHFTHHLGDTHVAHHFFSRMPHYNCEEATIHLKKALGKYYLKDDTPTLIALWKTARTCRFVEDDGDVVFYKN